MSKRISQLEERLGARLFQRTTRHLTLTETGAGYFKRVVDILSLCEEAEDFVSRRNTKPRGLLKVTMPTAFSRLHIAPYIDNFLARYPEIELDVHIGDAFVDIIREGFDLAIRIGELEDSSLVARRIASDTRVDLRCAGVPRAARHASGPRRPRSPQLPRRRHGRGVAARRTGRRDRNSIRTATCAPIPASSSASWCWRVSASVCCRPGTSAQALRSGALRVVLPEYRAASSAAVHAVYPSREFMPAKVNVLIEFLADLYGSEPYWDKDLDLDKVAQVRPAARQISRRVGKASPVAATR